MFANTRILIIDDEPGIRRTTGLAVETMGHEVVGVPNGGKALKAVEEARFDACLASSHSYSGPAFSSSGSNRIFDPTIARNPAIRAHDRPQMLGAG